MFVFNLLPLYPLDGWTIVLKLLPRDLQYQWEKYKVYTTYAFWGLLILSFVTPFNILGEVIGQPINFLLQLFLQPLFGR